MYALHQRFLRRREGSKARLPLIEPEPTATSGPSAALHDRGAEVRKPPVPSHLCPAGGTERVQHDLIYANAMAAITAAPPPPPPGGIDYLHKPDYGRVPAYLASVKEEIRREDALLARFLQRRQHQLQQRGRVGGGSGVNEEEGEEEGEGADEEKPRGVLAPLAEGERQELVDALKAKWDALNAVYQKTAHHGGRHQSSGAQLRKEAQERALQQLEADIELLERGGTGGGLYVRYEAGQAPTEGALGGVEGHGTAAA